MSLKRRYSEYTTQESQTQLTQPDEMPNAHSGRGSVSKRRKFSRYPRKVSRPLRVSTHAIVPRTVFYDMNFATDVALGFGFSPTNLWINNSSSVAIPGASDLSNLYDLVRIKKVEITIMPGCTGLGYGSNTLTTDKRNVPYAYHAVDHNSGGNPTITEMQQYSNLKMEAFDKVIRRTLYPAPKFSAAGVGTVSLQGAALKDVWIASAADEPCFGFKLHMDLYNTALTYDVARINFKIFYECKDSQ